MIPDEQVVITISHAGYIKRTRLTEYRSQSRGGVGAKGSSTREEDFLEKVLEDLEKITIKIGFFTIATGPAEKILEDGRNAHLIQKPPSWWLMKLCKRFEIEHLQKNPDGFLIIVKAKSLA